MEHKMSNLLKLGIMRRACRTAREKLHVYPEGARVKLTADSFPEIMQVRNRGETVKSKKICQPRIF